MGHTPPKFGETVFFRNKKYGRISIFTYDVYRTFLLIVSRSQRKAYLLGNSLKGILSTIFGNEPVEKYYRYLLELSKKPSPDVTPLDIAFLIRPLPEEDRYENVSLANDILGGSGLSHLELQKACNILDKAIDSPNVLYAIQLLDFSYSQVCGFMVGSYYQAHYQHDRREASRYDMDKRYLESRIAYDTAFLSAFRGVEAVLQKPHFKKKDVKKLLATTDSIYGTDFSTAKYRTFYEVFSSRRKIWSYKDIIIHYLKLRNSVAAHGDVVPPDIIMEDQVFEIQLLLKSMFMDILDPR